MTEAERSDRVNELISPKTADALTLVMTHEGVSRAEALRRLVGYGELVFRTVRLENGEVLLRHGFDVEKVVLLDSNGSPLVHDLTSLVWMRPASSAIACAFTGVDVAAGLDPLEPIARCDRWPVADLVKDAKAQRCPTCKRIAKRWRVR